MTHHAGDGCVGLAHLRLVQIREVFRRGLAGGGINAGVNGLVGAVSVEEHAAVRLAVVKLGEAHPRYLRPLSVAAAVHQFQCVGSGGGGGGNGEGPGRQVGGVGLRRVSDLYGDDLIHRLFRDVENRLLAVRGIQHLPLARQPVHVFQQKPAARGRGGVHHRGDVALHRRKAAVLLAVPAHVLMAVQQVNLVGKAEERGLILRALAHNLGCCRCRVQREDQPAKGGKGPLLAVYHALPRAGENRVRCGGRVAALRAPCVPCRFQVQYRLSAGAELQVLLPRHTEIPHLAHFAVLDLGIPVRVLVQAQKLADLQHLNIVAGCDLSHRPGLLYP